MSPPSTSTSVPVCPRCAHLRQSGWLFRPVTRNGVLIKHQTFDIGIGYCDYFDQVLRYIVTISDSYCNRFGRFSWSKCPSIVGSWSIAKLTMVETTLVSYNHPTQLQSPQGSPKLCDVRKFVGELHKWVRLDAMQIAPGLLLSFIKRNTIACRQFVEGSIFFYFDKLWS